MDSQAQARRAVSVSEARALVMATLPGRRGVDAALTDAAGLLTVDSTLAREDMPRHDTAAMDGYAVRVADLAEASGDRPARLRITGSLLAGDTAGMSLERGHTVRIMTGARCPPGCEAVIPHEVAAVDGDTVSFAAPARLGANLRRAGEDVRAGNLLIPAGAPLHAARVALLAAQGIDQIRVFARPRVAIVTTGDELVGGGELRDGEIRDSNTSMLERLCLEIGAEIVETRRVGDSPDALDLALEEVLASRPDLIVTAGGASSGDRDVVTGLGRGGRQVHLLNVRMRPGRPLICGSVAEVALIGLPGNPAAAYVSATQFVAPAIRHLLGHDHVLMSTVPARLVEPIDDRAGRTTFFRVRLDMDDQGYVATPIGPLNAADLAGLAAADGLLIVPEEIETVPADAVLAVQPISGM